MVILAVCIHTFSFGQMDYAYYSKTELEQDLDFFSKKVSSIHPLLLDSAIRHSLRNNISYARESLKDSMTQNEFYLLLAPSLSFLNDDHSFVKMPLKQRIQYSKAGGLAFPFNIEIIDSKIFITQYFGDDSTLFVGGEEILQINGVSSAEMVSEMQKLFGGNSLANIQKAVASNFRFLVWMIFGFENDYQMLVRNNQNQVYSTIVSGISNEQFLQNFKRMPPKSNEIYSFSIDRNFFTSIMKIQSFGQLESFCSFADNAFQELATNNISNLIIDIRGNGGGRSIVVDSLMNFLTEKEYSQYKKIEIRVCKELKERYKERYPEQYDWINSFEIDELVNQDAKVSYPLNNKHRYKGKLFLLTDKTTASAAATFAGIFKELNLGLIIGEETGGTIEYYGDYWEILTPNTAIAFCIAPKRFTQFGGVDLNRGVAPDFMMSNTGDSIISFAYSLIQNK